MDDKNNDRPAILITDEMVDVGVDCFMISRNCLGQAQSNYGKPSDDPFC